MSRSRYQVYAGIVLGLIGIGSHSGIAAAEEDFVLREIAPGMYFHQGLHQDYTPANHGDIANVGFVSGKRCVAVLDSSGSPSLGRRLLRGIRRITRLPICYVINTHMHPDHVLGNTAFVAEHPHFVGHKALTDAVPANRQYFIDQFLHKLGEDLNPEQLVVPDQLVDGKMRLDLGDRSLILQSYPKAHTSSDLTVFDEQTRTFWLGDLLFVDRIPAIDGSVVGWLQVMDEVERIPAARLVPGHGPVVTQARPAYARQRQYLQSTVTKLRRLIKDGGTLEQALKTVGQDQRRNWQLFSAYHKRNVTKAYAELEWE